MMSSTRDNLSLYDDQDFIDSLQLATGWTDNPPKLTKSQAPSLSTILEYDDKDTAWQTGNIDVDECQDDESEPELTLNIELEEGWETEPRPTAAELASDLEEGAGDNIEDDSSLFTLCRSWPLAPSTRTGGLYRRSPPTGRPIMMVSQSVGPGKLTFNRYGNEILLVEDQLAVTSPEFMMYTPEATPPKKRSVLLQTSANPTLAARGRKLSAHPKEISSEPSQYAGIDARDFSIRMIPRPDGFIIPTWVERRVVSCRARSINLGSSTSSILHWPSFSILDEALYFDDEDEIIKYPRNINVKNSKSNPCLPNRTYSCYRSSVKARNASSSTYLAAKKNVLKVEAETLSQHSQLDSDINGLSPEPKEIESRSPADRAGVFTSGTAMYNEISDLSALCLQQKDGHSQTTMVPTLKQTYTGADSYSNFSRFVVSEHTTVGSVRNGQPSEISQTKTIANSTCSSKSRGSNILSSGSIGLDTREPSDTKIENQTEFRGNFSNSSSSAAPAPSRQMKAPTKTRTKTRASQTTSKTQSNLTSASLDKSSVSGSSRLPGDETRVTTSQQQADQTRILITGPFRIPPPPPLPRPPLLIPCSKLRKRNTDRLTILKTEKKEDENTASWSITRTSFIKLVDHPIMKKLSIRQASIPLSPNEAERELLVSAIRPIPYLRPAARINHRVVPPISKTNMDDSASRNASAVKTKTDVGSRISKVHRVEVPGSEELGLEVDDQPVWQETPIPGEPQTQTQIMTQSTGGQKPEEHSIIKTSGQKMAPRSIPKSRWRCRFIASTSNRSGPTPDNTSRLLVPPIETSQLTMLSSRSVMTERLDTRPPVQFDFTASLPGPEPPPIIKQPVGHVPRRINIRLVPPSAGVGARLRPDKSGAAISEGKVGFSSTPRGRVTRQTRGCVKQLAKSYPTQSNTGTYMYPMTYASRRQSGFTSHSTTCQNQGTSRCHTFMVETSLPPEDEAKNKTNCR